MASSVDSCSYVDVEPGSFRRSQSRVYFESDNITSPTSWEFRGIAGSPVPMRLSVLRVSASETSATGGSSCSKGELCADGSRNSTGSSTGSHRSQDSGFSDSGETRGQRRNCSGSQHSSHHQKSSSTSPPPHHEQQQQDSQRRHVENVNQFDSKNPELTDPTTINQNLTTSQNHYQHLHSQYFPSPSSHPHQPTAATISERANHDDDFNLIPNVIHHFTPSPPPPQPPSSFYIPDSRRHSFRETEPITTTTSSKGCSNCVYHSEIILARSLPGSPLSPLPADQSNQNISVVELGAPTCASTPKRSSPKKSLHSKNHNINIVNTNHHYSHRSRPDVMDKIDNFESLNKNKKCLDNNNNTSSFKELLHHGGKNFVNSLNSSSGTYETVVNKSNSGGHYNTSIVSIGSSSGKRIPSPSSPTKSIYETIREHSGDGGHSFQSYDSNHNKHEDVVVEEEETEEYDDWNSNSSVVNKSFNYTSRPSYLHHRPSSPKWATLPRGYKRVVVPGSQSGPSQEVIVKSHFDNDSLRLWIHELRFQAEPECLYTLQTKAICSIESSSSLPTSTSVSSSKRGGQIENFLHSPSSPTSPLNSTTLAIHSVSAPLFSIRNVKHMACVISGEFSNICKHLEFGYFGQIPLFVESLSELLSEFLKHFHESFGNLQKLENRLATSCYELRLASRTLNLILSSSAAMNANLSESKLTVSQNVIAEEHEMQFHAVVREIVDKVADLGHLFSQVVDQRLTRDLNAILNTIEGGGIPARVGLRTYATVLNDGGTHICRLAASIRTVRGLLGVLLDSKDEHTKILALRCLATVLCVGEAVKDFDKAGGFEIVADILYDPIYESAIKYEAVAVLTQATDPWIDLETTLVNLSYHLEKILVSLTNLIPHCKVNEDTFLLTIAAISNLTFLEISSLDILRRCRTISLILNAIREKRSLSIFILDHVATVLANMAGSERCRKGIVSSGGVAALVCFLQQRPLPSGSAAEISACERLLQKSTIAISRLCNEEGVAKLVMDMNGLQRMIELCRKEKERHYSDGVLIACLATLRKLVTFCGDKIVQGLDAEDLVQPRLLDSFLLYSSRQESYV